MTITLKPLKKLQVLPSSYNNNNKVDNLNNASMSTVAEIDDTKLWNVDAFTPSSRFGNVSLMDDHAHDNDIPPDFSRASAEFYTPTYQAMKNSTFFKHREYSKRLSNASTLYESTILEGYDPDFYGHLNSVPEEINSLPRRGKINGTSVSSNCEDQDFTNATPVECQLNHRPKPFKEFLDEVQTQKQRAEIDASRKESYTSMLRKLRIREEAIDAWESRQKSKAENQLDKLERKMEKQRARLVQKTHRRLMETEQEAEKRKAIARRDVLKEMSKLQLVAVLEQKHQRRGIRRDGRS